MATRVISTSIKLDGETEFKKQLSNVNSELKTLRSEMSYNEEAFKGQANTMEALTKKDELLRKEIEQQEEKVRALEQAVEDATEAYGDSDKRTDNWRQSLNRAKTDLLKMNRELEDNSKYLEEAKKSADKTADSIDGFGREAKNAADDAGGLNDVLESIANGGGLGDFMGKLDSLKGMLAGGAVAVGVKELTGAILELEESTREYRQIMGTLETSSASAGYTAEQTSEAYQRLYGVLGDNQTAATTVANLQAIKLSQEELMELIDATTGAWGTYGDSIPIDGLAESINETIKAGQVTGTFADVLNWGAAANETFCLKLKENVEFTELSKKELDKLNESQLAQYEATKQQYEEIENFNASLGEAQSAEDLFNIALGECTTEAERSNLVMKALASQGLAETGRAWRENNADIVQMNEAQSELDEAMGRMGELLAPLAAKLINFGADALGFVVDKAKAAVDWFKRLNDTLNNTEGLDAYKELAKGSGTKIDGSNANGLSYVPFDGYISELHRGEAVLTADEAAFWRRMGSVPARQPDISAAVELEKAAQAAISAMAYQQSDVRQDIVINLTAELDGDVLARKQMRYNARQRQLAGTSMIDGEGY